MSDTAAIVAFTKDWDDVPTATTHVLRGMGRVQPVLWINSIGVRKPSLGSGRDLRRVLRKGKAALRQRFIPRCDRIETLSPCVIPKAESNLARGFNRLVLGRVVRRQLARIPHEGVELWAFVPNAADYLGCFGERKLIYYCVDDWSSMPGLDSAWITERERCLAGRASIVFATSRQLVRKLTPLAPQCEVHYLPHGVDHGHFATALEDATAIPSDIASLPRPRVGFYGTLGPHLDFPLVAELAARRPEWSFVVIGPARCDTSRWEGIANLHLLGRREHAELPACCKGFDAAIIPYDLAHPLIASVNPIKARELLAAGVPIVSSGLEEMQEISHGIAVAGTVDEWLASLERQVCRTDRRAISDSVLQHDWQSRLDRLRKLVDNAPPLP